MIKYEDFEPYFKSFKNKHCNICSYDLERKIVYLGYIFGSRRTKLNVIVSASTHNVVKTFPMTKIISIL